MSVPQPESIAERLLELQRLVRDQVIKSVGRSNAADVSHESSADTIYRIDTDVEPMIEAFCDRWSRSLPMILIAEGFDEAGVVLPRGTDARDAKIRIIIDPIDGTRGIMYDKRSAWSLAGVAPNLGPATKLSDIEVAAMTELPTSKMGRADVLSAVRGGGVQARRIDLTSGAETPFTPKPSNATTLAHGFASVANFFPGTKQIAGRLMDAIALAVVGSQTSGRPVVFDDQYISSGGQLHEVIVGHDRFVIDLRPQFDLLARQESSLCAHPYDLCTVLIAREAGVIVTDGFGRDLDGPLDCTTNLSWAAFANETIRRQVEPVVRKFFEVD